MQIKASFTTPFQQYAGRRGQPFVLVGPVDPSTYDATEVGPLYRIRFEDGVEIDAWGDEIFDTPPNSEGE